MDCANEGLCGVRYSQAAIHDNLEESDQARKDVQGRDVFCLRETNCAGGGANGGKDHDVFSANARKFIHDPVC